MKIEFIEFQPAKDFATVQAWAASKGLPKPWQMQVHPDNYPGWITEVEWRIAFEMPDGRKVMIREEDYIGLDRDGSIHAVDWLDMLKNFEVTATPATGEGQ